MKPIAIPETKEDREERMAHALIDSMCHIDHFHKPDGPSFEPTPQGVSTLAKQITKLGQELRKKPIIV